MAFESLSDKLTEAFKRLRGKGRLTEADVKEAMREVKLALLEADVNFKVVKDFVRKVTERATGADVLESLSPAQMVIKIVNEELTALMGSENQKLNISSQSPSVVMLVGLQGAGKTTNGAKLAGLMRKQGKHPLLVACDVYRPAAIQQLETVGRQLDIPVFQMGQGDPVEIAKAGIEHAKKHGNDLVFLDTAGRLHIDEALMTELQNIKAAVNPAEILLVIDAMIGQDAVATAQAFDDALDITGVMLTKLDGDARGGAALSIKALTGKPIKFAGIGEKLDQIEPFHPDRMASRILDLGDILTLIEQAQAAFDEAEALKVAEKLATETFTLEDFLEQMQQMRKMGSMKKMLGMLPGMGQMKSQLENFDEREIDRTEAIIRSMTPAERRNTKLLNGSRRLRIARGSGMTVTDVNQLVQRFEQAAKMMKTVARGGTPNIPGMGPTGKPGASSKRGNKQKARSGSRSGNPAKRAAENAGIAAQADAAGPSTGSGSGFGLGGAKGAPAPEDLAELQKLLGRG